MNFILGMKPGSKHQLVDFYNSLLHEGVWHAEELLLINEAEIRLFQEALLMDRTKFWSDLLAFKNLSENSKKLIYGIKVLTDGSLGSRTAKLNDPYLTGGDGSLSYSDDDLFMLFEEVAALNMALSIHAIGDAAIDQSIRVLNRIKKSENTPREVRIEHCQLISKETALQAKHLGIILCMQPNFSIDSEFYKDRLSKSYCERNNPFRMLIDEVKFICGRDLIFGSDGMPHGVDFALKTSLYPPFPGQKLTIDEFVSGYCMPDMKNGYIDVEIDDKNKSISTEITFKQNAQPELNRP